MRSRAVTLSLAVVLAAAPHAAPAPPYPLPLFARGTVKRSLALALEGLRRPECRAVYDDFRDASGATLAEGLRRRDVSPSEHLLRLRWLNGVSHPRCRDRNVFLVTRVGDPEIYVCPEQFTDFAVRQPVKAAGLLLHEQLHALGLGEDPPASGEISRQVFARCGS
jgi:hypothetical protein